MADEKGRGNNFSDFDASDIFTDFKTHSENENRRESFNRQKFVVRIDDGDNDSFDYDFAAFSNASEREKEEKRREESRRSLSRLGNEADGRKSVQKPFSTVDETVQKRQRVAVPYRTPVQRRAVRPGENTAGGAVTGEKTSSPVQKPVARPEQVKAPVKGSEPTAQPQQTSPDGASVADTVKRIVRLKTRTAAGAFNGIAGFIAIALVFSIILTSVGLSTIGDILAYNRGETSVTVVIENEKNGNSPTLEHVIGALHSAGLIKQKNLCVLFAKFRHFDGYTNSKKEWVPTEYISGIYYLEPDLGLEGMLNMIKKSTSTGADTVTLTFPEGWTISQIFERLEKNGVCDASKLYANIESVAKQYDFYYNLNQSGVRYLGVEGYLFPDTYEFYRNENAVSVLKKLFDNSDAKWTKQYQKRAKELGYTRDEILNIASIIQREAANSSQMGNVASVIHNRMRSSTYPSLQCNSTLDYVTNSVKPQVDANLADVYANAYNTYRVEGLPPGPICNPGIDAIEAALYPNETNYYFFVHNDKGKIYLSENYAQFQRDCIQAAKDNAS